jgi:hypothetical protein
VSVFVNGHLRRRVAFGTLQRQVTPRLPLAPGRYRVAAVISFQPGSGTPPVILVATVRVCGARRVPVRFTG